MHSRSLLGFALLLTLSLVAAACGGGQPAAPPAGEQPAAAPAAVDPATAANINGKITLEGTAPPNEPIKMNADPVCLKTATGPQTAETFVVGEGGGLGNVFVYVKDGLGSRTFPAPTEPVTIDQKACRYYPHVMGVMVGQPLQIVNSDPTLHNIHATPKANTEFNTGQPIQGMKTDRVFTAPEVMVPFKCDVHGWMNAYAGVLNHPFFAVTPADGTFSIKGLPPGTYTIEAWHEKLGPMTQSVTVAEKETKDANFTFKAGSGN